MELSINLTVFFAIIAGLLGVLNLWEKMHGYMPSHKLAQRLAKAEELLERDNQHLKEHDAEIRTIHEKVDVMDKTFAEQNYIIIKCMSAMLTYMISGNNGDVEQLKRVNEELQEYLIKH